VVGGYALGVDLGTTFTAASVHTGQRAEPVTLGANSLGIPSIVHLAADGTARIGEEALGPAIEDPSRLVYEFKRHIGSDTDLLLPDGPRPPTEFSTRLLRWVLDRVAQRMHGRAPAVVAVTHPAHWNAHELARHRQVLVDAGVADALAVTEPEAAATFYATHAPVAPGDVVAVYDLGGGTFDTAVVRRHGDGFTILGRPGGIGHLGGADFDRIVFAILNDHLEGALTDLDVADPEVLTDLYLLAEECTRAKEQLSANTHVTVPVRVGPLKRSIRVTRAEFEHALRPRLVETIATLEDALRSAGIDRSEVSRVLLVGGSSRIPLVRALVEEALGVPVSEDTDPVSAVAIGAAIHAHLHTAGPAPGVDLTAADSAPGGDRHEPATGTEAVVHDAATDHGGTHTVGDHTITVEPLRREGTGGPTLRVELADGPAISLRPGRVLRIGRSPDNDVVLTSEVVSRHHGELHHDARSGWRFTDPGSRNGTFLDGAPLPKVRRFSRDPRRSAVLPPAGSLRLGRSGPEIAFSQHPSEPAATLQVRCGSRSVALRGPDRVVVGRSARSDVVVQDPTRRVSSVHLELRPGHDGWVALDVSANGTFVDGSPLGVDPAPITAGLELRLGSLDGPLLVVEEGPGDGPQGRSTAGTERGDTVVVDEGDAGAGPAGSGERRGLDAVRRGVPGR
jgi:pSer/pThr/pTyr-binding forkhead associated (FHA) protein/Ethanolamine utilization protein EutJ (predicted chaperonin)